MEVLGAIRLPGCRGPDDGNIAGQFLPDRASAEQIIQHFHLFKRWHNALHAHHRDMCFRYGGGEVTVAFVGHQIDRAQVGDSEVAAGDPDIRFQELLPQYRPGKTGQVLRTLIAGIAKLLREHALDLRPVLMQRRGHNM
ncbi:hypothetical protein D3C73_948760 [compost metagenome]